MLARLVQGAPPPLEGERLEDTLPALARGSEQSSVLTAEPPVFWRQPADEERYHRLVARFDDVYQFLLQRTTNAQTTPNNWHLGNWCIPAAGIPNQTYIFKMYLWGLATLLRPALAWVAYDSGLNDSQVHLVGLHLIGSFAILH